MALPVDKPASRIIAKLAESPEDCRALDRLLSRELKDSAAQVEKAITSRKRRRPAPEEPKPAPRSLLTASSSAAASLPGDGSSSAPALEGAGGPLPYPLGEPPPISKRARPLSQRITNMELIRERLTSLGGALPPFQLSPAQIDQLASMLSNELEASCKTLPKTIAEIDELVLDFLHLGHSFKGVPIIRSFSLSDTSVGIGLSWASKDRPPSPKLRVPGTPFFAANPRALAEVQRIKATGITNRAQLFSLFQHFKKTIPHKFTEDGCNPRCLWVTHFLQKLTNLDCYKIKVWSKDGKTPLLAASPFPRSRWLMHTAPVVRLEGREYVLDLSLERPMEIEEWKRNLCGPDASKITLSTSRDWNKPCLSSPDQAAPPDTFREMLDDLRGLYLFQRVSNNDIAQDSWQNWIRRPTGMRSLSAPKERTKTVPLVYKVSKTPTGKIDLKIRNIALSPEILSRSEQIGKYFVMKHLVKKIPGEVFRPQPVYATASKGV